MTILGSVFLGILLTLGVFHLGRWVKSMSARKPRLTGNSEIDRQTRRLHRRGFWRGLLLQLTALNWLLFGSISFLLGGTAAIGEIVGDDYLVRLNDAATPTSVSRATWIVSLAHASATFALTPLCLGLALLIGKKDAFVSWMDFIALGFLVFVSALIILAHAPGLAAWLNAA